MAMLELQDLHTFFTTKRGIVKAVNGVSYSVESGRTLGVVGAVSYTHLDVYKRQSLLRYSQLSF